MVLKSLWKKVVIAHLNSYDIFFGSSYLSCKIMKFLV